MVSPKLKVNIDKERAAEKFTDAFILATSEIDLPTSWREHTLKIKDSPSKTFIPVLGTALLAKCVDSDVDVFALRAGEGHKSYSARSLAKDVFVPCARKYRVDIGTSGAEPLNNQPFLRAKRINSKLQIKENAKLFYKKLLEALKEADFLDSENALLALASFLRTRLEISPIPRDWSAEIDIPLTEAANKLDEFVLKHVEGGKVGQAIVAAIFDTFYSNVTTRKINDPSVHSPGDVIVRRNDTIIISCEVKQRTFLPHEIIQFSGNLAKANITRGLIAAFNQKASKPNWNKLREQCYLQYGVTIFVCETPGELLWLLYFFNNSDRPHEGFDDLISFIHKRLGEIEVSRQCIKDWEGFVS